jgi:hypothetical protein
MDDALAVYVTKRTTQLTTVLEHLIKSELLVVLPHSTTVIFQIAPWHVLEHHVVQAIGGGCVVEAYKMGVRAGLS